MRPDGRHRVRGVGVVVPARDEQDRVGRCLVSVVVAARAASVPVHVVVALDRCVDGTREVAEAVLAHHTGGWDVVDVPPGPPTLGVGHVRDAGVGAALHGLGLSLGPVGLSRLWLAHTDADSVVPATWLTEQLRHADRGADGVVGFVHLDDDDAMSHEVTAAHDRIVSADRRHDGSHGGVWGANLGVRASTLDAAGGFPTTVHGEDVVLVARLDAAGVPLVRTEDPVVLTSARTTGRAAGGLADLLRRLETARQAQPSGVAS